MNQTPPEFALPHQQAQAMLAAIVESSDDAIVSKTLEGIITSWNKGAERIFGYPSAEMIGQPLLKIIPTERQHEETMILSRIRSGEPVDHFDTVRQRKDGTLIDVSVTISPIRDETGRIIGASKIARDVTQQKLVQRELLAAKDAAEAASQAKDHFLSVLSHELRTPLTPVLAAVSLIESQPTMSQQELRGQVEMIRRNVETEARLVDDLLDLTRIARGKIRLHFEVVDAHAVIRNVLSMLQAEMDEKRLAVTSALRAGAVHVWADAARLQQIFLNLLSNAVKFTPADGTITVRSSNENGWLSILISDTGVGIEPDVLPRLFSAFEQGERTVTRRFGGLGLGLSIVKSLAEMHSGTIAAASEGKDRGATFTLRLKTVPAAPHAQQTQGAARPGAGHRILLVEDHADTREVLDRLLSSMGCTVWSVGSVKEALELSNREPFDLLVSDIGLPDGTGHEVMSYLRTRHGRTRGIALSGFGQDDDMRRSREAGFELHLIKPVNFQTLKEVILKIAG